MPPYFFFPFLIHSRHIRHTTMLGQTTIQWMRPDFSAQPECQDDILLCKHKVIGKSRPGKSSQKALSKKSETVRKQYSTIYTKSTIGTGQRDLLWKILTESQEKPPSSAPSLLQWLPLLTMPVQMISWLSGIKHLTLLPLLPFEDQQTGISFTPANNSLHYLFVKMNYRNFP